jgi:putative tryptophan/tyrosine transport system substrate-binding protein
MQRRQRKRGQAIGHDTPVDRTQVPGRHPPPEPEMFTTNRHRKLIVELSAGHRLPAIYGQRSPTAEGGLMFYGVDLPDLFRKAAVYANRILKGENPADLPVQAPTKYELVINVKTANVLGLTVSPTLLARADEVIE